MNPHTRHEMVIANAGSGKTFRLTTRVLTLLALDVEPRKIAALTFTKMAAGEFVDKLVERLAKAALDPKACTRLAADIEVSQLDPERCRQILRKFANQMSALCMGTIDSLFGRIARAFPLESGLPGELSVLDATDVQAARQQAIAELFLRNADSEEKFADFVELIRRQSQAGGERDVFARVLRSTEELQDKFLESPEEVRWGDRHRIWPDSCPVLDAGSVADAADQFWEPIINSPDLPDDAALDRWSVDIDKIRDQPAGQPLTPEIKKILKDRLLNVSDGKGGPDYIPTGGKRSARLYLTPAVDAARLCLIRALAKGEFESLLRRSRALHDFVGSVEAIYDALTRRSGRLTFGDITHLLAGLVDDPDWIANIGYRMDAGYDHWLLDEFQDTSRDQWRVLSTFIDEVIQDAEQRRSFFYVGDTKQALYLWRGGDPRLFFEVFEHYNSELQETISKAELLQSYRSGPEIIDVVNRVFGQLEQASTALQLPAETVARWQQAWREHESAPGFAPDSSFVRWVTVQTRKRAKDDDDEDGGEIEIGPEDVAVLDILREAEPWRRGLECAVLVRNNKDGENIAAILQSEAIPVNLEGKSNPCLDNALGISLLLAFRLVAHPDDRCAHAILAGYPIGQQLLTGGEADFREMALRSIAEVGYAATCRDWIATTPLNGESFLADRALAFVEAAAEFDARRGPDDGLAQFLAFIEGRSIQRAECSGTVRVMTIHQAKGLTFDMAILTHVDKLLTDRLANSLVLGGGRPPSWGLLMPSRGLSDLDDTLRDARMSALADEAYGAVCAAYVAMTRPRHALYIVTPALGKTSVAKTFGRLLSLTLPNQSNGFESGCATWFERATILDVTQPDPSNGESLKLPGSGISTPRAVVPSARRLENSEAPAGAGGGGISFGRDVHDCLSKVDWLGTNVPAFKNCSTDAAQAVIHFFQSDQGKKIFTMPPCPPQLWREQSFDVILDGAWTSGVFDRVHVELDDHGNPVAGVIYEFKTDQMSASDLERKYAAQRQTYIRALSTLLRLDSKMIRCELVVT